MEQSSNGGRSFLPELTSAEELEVSEILPQLPQLIAESFTRRVWLRWGATRKRSAIDSAPPVSFSSSPLQFAPSSALSEHKRDSESPPLMSSKVVALSPATPLAFFPSESDEKHKSSRKKFALKKELENAKDFHHKLKTSNFKLKARKQKINAEPQRLKIESEFANLKLESSPASVADYPPSLIKEQRSQANETSSLGAKDLNLSPLGIPDLNISLEESHGGDSPQAAEISRAMAAQARQKRIQIYRMKNGALNKQPRLSSR